jgi:hypothetical protein
MIKTFFYLKTDLANEIYCDGLVLYSITSKRLIFHKGLFCIPVTILKVISNLLQVIFQRGGKNKNKKINIINKWLYQKINILLLDKYP